MDTKQENAYQEVKEKVEKLKSFYKNLISYIIINIFLIGFNLYQSPYYLWCLWVIFPWGIGLIFQYFSIFHLNFFGKNWEERKIKELMEK